jgi:hypothetical protein
MSARVGLGTAWHMWVTAPGFFSLERSWILLHPNSTVWDQIPPLILGIAAIPATFALTRYFRFPRWICLGAALAVSVSPTGIIYSTRLKEYGADFLLACLLLALGEAARRRPDRRELLSLSVATVCSFAVSASTLPVLLGVWLALGLTTWARRRRGGGRRFLVAAVPAVVGCLLVDAVFYRHISPVIRRDFIGYYFVFTSPRAFISGAASILVNLYGHLVGVLGGGRLGPPLLFVVVSVLLLLGLRARRDMAGPALGIGAALVACALGVIPLGTGRTDEILYPALLLLIASALEALGRSVTGRDRTIAARVVFAAVGALLVTALVLGGINVDNRYPATDARALASALERAMKPGDHVVVDELMRYPWAYDEDNPLRLEFGGNWSTGFTVISTQPRVFIAPSEYYEGGSDPTAWTRHMASFTRLWFVETPPLQLSPFYSSLRQAGWRPVATIRATGCAAILLERTPARPG